MFTGPPSRAGRAGSRCDIEPSTAAPAWLRARADSRRAPPARRSSCSCPGSPPRRRARRSTRPPCRSARAGERTDESHVKGSTTTRTVAGVPGEHRPRLAADRRESNRDHAGSATDRASGSVPAPLGVPLRIALERGRSSVGRASASQAEGRGFDPRRPLRKALQMLCSLVALKRRFGGDYGENWSLPHNRRVGWSLESGVNVGDFPIASRPG